MTTTRKIELLAPAKDLATALDAIMCGADAVYIGAPAFGARHAASNSISQIGELCSIAHVYGVRVYVTMNTLLWDEELDEARNMALQLREAGVDALIVQDMAYLQMGLQMELHASTQTTCTSPEKLLFFEKVGLRRAVLERSLFLEQIRAIREKTSLELEAFIHGAICVCQSGKCFLSKSISGRSGNRGECSQPCRLEWDLTDSERNVILKSKHLLSVRDMDLTLHIEELLDAGVTSLKIEGRLKDNSYVRNTVSHYRHILDGIISRRSEYSRSSWGESHIGFEPDPRKSFTRDGTDYFLMGKHPGVASLSTPKAMGEKLGKVLRREQNRIILSSEQSLAPGDGICFLGEQGLKGTNVNRVTGDYIELNSADAIRPGTILYRNFDKKFTDQVLGCRPRRTLRCSMHFEAGEGYISLQATAPNGVGAYSRVEFSSQQANDPEKMVQTIATQLSKSGDTPFTVADITIEDNGRFIPSGVLSALRRDVLAQLESNLRMAHPAPVIFVEKAEAEYPESRLEEWDNVTNRLAHRFYMQHGVEKICPATETAQNCTGRRVMISDYCIRREIGECLKFHPKHPEALYLERGYNRYRLEFDCKRCQMSIFDQTKHFNR